MKPENKRILWTSLILVTLFFLTYTFSPERKFVKIKKVFSPFIQNKNVLDFVGILEPEYMTKINDLIEKYVIDLKTQFKVVILPETYGYNENDILNLFFKLNYEKSPDRFQIVLLIIPKYGLINMELDKRLKYVLSQKDVLHIFNDILIASFKKSEIDYARLLKKPESIRGLESVVISEGIYKTLKKLGLMILKELPYLEERLVDEHKNQWMITFKYWLLYGVIFLIVIILINYWIYNHCPRCYSRLNIIRVKKNDRILELVKCPSCGYIRKKKKRGVNNRRTILS